MWPIWDRVKYRRFRRKKSERYRTVGRPVSRRGYNMKIDFEKIEWECVY